MESLLIDLLMGFPNTWAMAHDNLLLDMHKRGRDVLVVTQRHDIGFSSTARGLEPRITRVKREYL
jgi:hypothetical protein